MAVDIKCASDAGYIIQTALRSHIDPWKRMDNIENYLIRMDKPYSVEELENAGYSWMCNQNFGRGRNKVAADVAQNASEIMQSLAFIQAEFRPYNHKVDTDKIYQFLEDDKLRIRFKDTIVGRFLDSLEMDNYLGSWLKKIEYCTYTFGHCTITRDMFSYLGNANHPRYIAYEDRTRTQNVQTHILFDNVKADYLYQKLKELGEIKDNQVEPLFYFTGDPTENGPSSERYAPSDNGWVMAGLLEVFRNALVKLPVNQKKKEKTGIILEDSMTVDNDNLPINPFNSWQDIETFVNHYGLPFLYSNINNIFLAKIYYWLDNDFYEVYVVITGDVAVENFTTLPTTNKYILYKKNHGKKKIKEVINVIREATLETNDYIHELKGSGKMIAEDSLRYDVKRCKLEDRLTINGCAVIETTSEFQANQLKLAVVGGLVAPESGVKILETPFKMNLAEFMSSIQFDEAEFQKGMSYVAPAVSQNLSNRATKGEVESVQQEVAAAKGTKIPFKFKDYSDVLFNAIRDLAHNDLMVGNNRDIRDYFLQAIKEDLSDLAELTDEQVLTIIDCIRKIHFTPAIRDLEALKQAMEMAGNSEQRKRLQKMYLMALGFDRKTAEEILVEEDYGTEVSIAAIENDMFKRTREVAFGPTQDHITHLQTHFADWDRAVQSLKQGGDMMQVFQQLSNGLPNTQEHLNAIEHAYFHQEKFKEFVPYQKNFIAVAQQLSAKIVEAQQQQQQQAQQQAPQLDPKTQADIQRKNDEAMYKMRRSQMLTEDKRRATAQLLQEKIGNAKAESQAKIDIMRAEADQKATHTNLQTSARLASTVTQPQTSITDASATTADISAAA